MSNVTGHRGLAESEGLLGLAQEAGRLGIFEWEVQTGTLRLSPKFLSIYGLTDFDGTYDNWLGCMFREDRPRYLDLIEKAFAAKESAVEVEFRIVRPSDGELRWIESRRVIVYDEDGRPIHVVGVSADVTERKRAAVQLRAFAETLEDAVKERTAKLESEHEARWRAEELLRQAQKMEAVGQLTGGVAHDFNNLLTIIQGGLEMIGRQGAALEASPAASRIVRGKEMALEGVRRAARLTERLLAFARQQPLEPRAVSVNRLTTAASELLRRMVGETIAVETVLSGGIWMTHADVNQLESAILNLVVNARDAMPNGGKVTIETANCQLDDAYVRKLAEPVKAGQYVMIAVSDNGTGMEQQTMGRAFEPFYTTKGVGKGTGLGLSQVYGFGWLIEIERELFSAMRPRSKWDRVVLSEIIIEAGLTLIAEAETANKLPMLTRARMVRNGLMLALLAHYLIRLKNFAALELGRSLVKVDKVWWIVLSASETKEKRVFVESSG